MAFGRRYDQRLHVPCAPRRSPQQPARVELQTLFSAIHTERAMLLGRTPRSSSWRGNKRPRYAPRFAPIIAGYPQTNTLRDQLVRRARLVQSRQVG